MDYNVISEKDVQIQKLFNSIDETISNIDKCMDNYQPTLNGDRFLTDNELADKLKIKKRTLYEYRKDRIIPYIALEGKIIYKERDIEKILEDNYVPALR